MSLSTAASDLRHEHDLIEELSRLLLEAYQSGSWKQVEIHWNELEPALRVHMAREEEFVLPSFRKMAPLDTAALLEEHVSLRAQLSAFGVNMELHAVPLGDVEAMVASNRAHSLREERLLSAWLSAVGEGTEDALDQEATRRAPTSQDALALIRGAHRHIFCG